MGDSADSAICTAALHSYFVSAATYLPILLADAFWSDYHASRCSKLLLFALACRGMPFTEAPNKWDLQQRLACNFERDFSLVEATHLMMELLDLITLKLWCLWPISNTKTLKVFRSLLNQGDFSYA